MNENLVKAHENALVITLKNNGLQLNKVLCYNCSCLFRYDKSFDILDDPNIIKYILLNKSFLSKSKGFNVNLYFIIAGGEGKEYPVVAFLKPTVKNNFYKATVGSERVSLQNQVITIINERSPTDCLSFPQELKTKFFSLKPNTREDMAQALLTATSFINVILNGRSLNFK